MAAIALLLGLVVAGCSTLQPPARTPLLTELAVGTVELRPLHLEASNADDADWLEALLSSEAAASVARAALERQIATRVSPGASLVLSGWVEIPIALPPGVAGSRAAFRKGVLAQAQLQLLELDGDEIAQGRAELGWRDVRWTRGGPKVRRARRPEVSLLDAVGRVLRLATDDLRRTLQNHRDEAQEE